MKKLIAIILALVMALAMTSVAFADGDTKATVSGKYEETDDQGNTFINREGTITINKYNSSNTYSIYRMLNLESFTTADGGKYSYVVNDDWKNFFKNGGEGAPYVTFNGDYVSWNTAKDSEVALFAEKALAYAKVNNIKPLQDSKKTYGESLPEAERVTVKEETVDGIATCVFGNLPLGYYLVDSTMGALCGLTTTNFHASINAKNGEPTMVKHVKLPNGNWGSENTASIGDVVEFHVDITVAAGAESYVIHDDLADSFTYVEGSVKVKYDDKDVEESTKVGETTVTNYTVTTYKSGKPTHQVGDKTLTCDFEVKFDPSFCDTLENGKTLTVSYKAVLNADAVIDGAGNVNVATLAFGEDHFTTPSQTVTKTYAFDLVKTDSQNFLLGGAFFTVHTDSSATEANQIPLILVEAQDGNPAYYRPALKIRKDENGQDIYEEGTTKDPIEVKDGIIRFQGFASRDYYFVEDEAPDGYNKLTAPAHFAMPASNKFAIFNDGVYSTTSGFQITNSNGVMLPETGGIGTLLFTALGGTTALGAGVVLVTKKRMSKIKDDEE